MLNKRDKIKLSIEEWKKISNKINYCDKKNNKIELNTLPEKSKKKE